MLVLSKIHLQIRLFRLLTYTPLPVHLGLLIVIPLLRLPTFHAEFFLLEESQLLVTAQKLLESGGIYAESWHTGPPLMVWIYSLFSMVFGSYALTAIRVFTCLYIYLSAIVFNGILAENKSFRRNSGLISVLFVLLVSTPWYSQEFNASLFVLLPVVLTFSQISQMTDRNSSNQGHMYIAGIWMMVAIIASYKTVFLLIGIFFAYLILHSFRIKEFMAFLAGMFTVLATMIFWLFRRGVLGEWWDQGILYYVDYLKHAGDSWYTFDSWDALATLAVSWGGFLIMAIIGFVHYRLNFYQYVRKARSTETMMAIWLVGVLVVLLFKLDRLIMPDFILLVPPLAFYIARTFDFKFVTKYRVLILLLLIAVPLWQYSGYVGMTFSKQLSFLIPSAKQTMRNGGLELHKARYAGVLKRINQVGENDEIWIMGNAPDLYLRSHRSPAVKYVDFRMAYFKLEDLPGYDENGLISKRTTSGEAFRVFQKEAPTLVLDAKNNFPSLQRRFPGIFGNYSSEKLGAWMIYSHP